MYIHDCCKDGNLQKLQRLITNNVDVNEKDIYGHTALHSVSCWGYLEMVKELIKHQALTGGLSYRTGYALSLTNINEQK